MSILIRTVLIALVLVTTVLYPQKSDACSCGPMIRNNDIALRYLHWTSDLIIRGTVQSVEETTLGELPPDVHPSRARFRPGTTGDKATLEPSRIWKGPDVEQIPYFYAGTLCDIPVEPGEDVVLLMYGPDVYGNYGTNFCRMMHAGDLEGETLAAALDEISAPRPLPSALFFDFDAVIVYLQMQTYTCSTWNTLAIRYQLPVGTTPEKPILYLKA